MRFGLAVNVTGWQILSAAGLIASVWLVLVCDIFVGSRSLLPESRVLRSTRRRMETGDSATLTGNSLPDRTEKASSQSSATLTPSTMDPYTKLRLFLDLHSSLFTTRPDGSHGLTTKRHANRRGTCGDGNVDVNEDCDCGGPLNCSKTSSQCCNALTCKFTAPDAQCAPPSPCCDRNCKLKKARQVCRPAKNSCDLPEYCTGLTASCPADAFHRNGNECGAGQGYCFSRMCMVRDDQCENAWGMHSSSSRNECYEHFNRRGVFNGHCGLAGDKMSFKPCLSEDVLCGALHCKGGGQSPVASSALIHSFAATIWANISGRIYQCKSINPEVLSPASVEATLVRDGTKCGTDKMCMKGHCVPFRHMLPANHCPTNNATKPCSGQGVCTDLNSCACYSGYAGSDCTRVVPNQTALVLLDLHHNSNMLNMRRGVDAKDRKTINEVVDNDALQIVVIIMSVLLLGATVVIMSLTCCRNSASYILTGPGQGSPALDNDLNGSVV